MQDKSLKSVQQKQAEQEEEDADAEAEEEEGDEKGKEEETSNGDDMRKTELCMLGKVKRKQKDEWEMKFQCANCNKCFSSSASLDQHSLRHEAKKPGICLKNSSVGLTNYGQGIHSRN